MTSIKFEGTNKITKMKQNNKKNQKLSMHVEFYINRRSSKCESLFVSKISDEPLGGFQRNSVIR